MTFVWDNLDMPEKLLCIFQTPHIMNNMQYLSKILSNKIPKQVNWKLDHSAEFQDIFTKTSYTPYFAPQAPIKP